MDYNGKMRSNDFRVKDVAAFLAWCERCDVAVMTDETPAGLLHGFKSYSGIPSTRCPDPQDITAPEDEQEGPEDQVEFSFLQELAEHLAPNSVAEVREVGTEGMRMLYGFAAAVHPSGEIIRMDFDDLLGQARERWGKEIEYTNCWC